MTAPFPFADIIAESPGYAWRGNVEVLPLDTYRPDPDGEPAWKIAVFAGGKLVDVVAVLDLDPFRPLCLRGTVLLGIEHYDRADILGGPLRLYLNPLAWLEAGDGVAIADWHRAPPLLARLQEIVCDDAEHADLVAARLLPWANPLPRLLLERKVAA